MVDSGGSTQPVAPTSPPRRANQRPSWRQSQRRWSATTGARRSARGTWRCGALLGEPHATPPRRGHTRKARQTCLFTSAKSVRLRIMRFHDGERGVPESTVHPRSRRLELAEGQPLGRRGCALYASTFAYLRRAATRCGWSPGPRRSWPRTSTRPSRAPSCRWPRAGRTGTPPAAARGAARATPCEDKKRREREAARSRSGPACGAARAVSLRGRQRGGPARAAGWHGAELGRAQRAAARPRAR